jgi:hypothetical protein
MTKRYAVDDVVQQIIRTLEAPQLPKLPPDSDSPVEQSISKWFNDHSLLQRRRSEWFNHLAEDDQRMIRDILEDCAEMSAGKFLHFARWRGRKL